MQYENFELWCLHTGTLQKRLIELPKPNVLDYERIGLNTLGKSIGTILSKEFGEQE